MKTAMTSLKEIVDVNTIVGEPVESPDGSVILPISRVSFGFAAGGGDYSQAGPGGREAGAAGAAGAAGPRDDYQGGDLAFAGGSGGGVTIHPVGFLVVGQGTVRMMPVDSSAMMDRVLDMAPSLMREAAGLIESIGNHGRRARREEDL